MTERTLNKPEIASQKKVIKLPPAIGDWTTYRPPKILVKRVKTGLYGFDRLSREELNDFLKLHYRFIESLFEKFKVDLGIGVEFYAVQVEQTTYLNFLRGLASPFVQGKISLPGFHEAVHFFTDLALANSIINHGLGSHDLEPINRTLTEAEAAVFSTVISEYLPLYAKAFQETTETPSFIFGGSSDIVIDPSVSTSSTFVVFSAEAAFNDGNPGKIVFGYPGAAAKRITAQYSKKSDQAPLDFSRLSAAALNCITAAASALLGKTTLSTLELHSLEIGDVVSLDTATNSAICLNLGGFLKLPVQPGILQKKKAVRIAGFREEEKLEVAPPPLETKEEKTAPAPAPLPAPPAAAPHLETPADKFDLDEEEFSEEDFEDFDEDFLDEEEKEAP